MSEDAAELLRVSTQILWLSLGGSQGTWTAAQRTTRAPAATIACPFVPAQLRASSHGWYRPAKNYNAKFHGTRGHASHPSVRHSALRRQRQRVPLACARRLEVTPHSCLMCCFQAVQGLVPTPPAGVLGRRAGPTPMLAACCSIC